MHRLVVLAAIVLCSACAAVAGLNEYAPVDCVEDCAAPLDAAAPADTATTDTGAAEIALSETSACTPIDARTVMLGSWSIDATEVTNAQYAAFLAAKGSDTAGQPAACAWNNSYQPSAGWPTAAEHCNHPVVRVDWCDALAYCKWAGKRLCGNPTGGATPYSGVANVAASQWYAACSRATGAKYLYGASYVAGVCVDDAYDGKAGNATTDIRRAVSSAASCRGPSAPYDALFDMNGNVAEWEDSCEKTEGPGDDCRTRGGSYMAGWDKCNCDEGKSMKREHTSDDVGFRCCSP